MAQVAIAVDGMTGSGKTTLVRALARKMNLKLMPEEFRDPYNLLEKFSYDKKWCYPMQLNFLITRYIQYKVASETDEGNYILDRSIYSDPIYASLYYRLHYLTKLEYQDYQVLYEKLTASLSYPRCLIFLECSFEQIMQRIEARGRSDELKLGREEYWRPLYQAYQERLEDIKYHQDRFDHCLFLNTEEMDFRQNDTVDKIVQNITNMINFEHSRNPQEVRVWPEL